MNINKIVTIAGINFKRTTWIAYLVAFLGFASAFIQNIIFYFCNYSGSQQISEGNELIIAIIVAAVLIPTVNFKKIMHLNGKKDDFFWACLLNYIVFSAILSLVMIILRTTIDTAISPVVKVWDILDIFGWMSNGIIIAFFIQFAFYMLLAVTVHTLTSIQTFWFGWVVDFVIASILGIFIPIVPLQAQLLKFFRLIIFNSNPISQIIVCLVLATAIYAVNIPVLSRKTI